MSGSPKKTSMNHTDIAQRVFRDEIAGLEEVLAKLGPEFDAVVDLILESSGKVVVTGLGKSGLIGHKIAATLASTGTPSVFLNASEALHGDLGMVSADDVVLMISNSGATSELVKMIPSLERIGARCAGIFGRTDSALCRRMARVLDAGVAKEACPLNLAPMSSATAALVLGDALAAALMTARGTTESDFAVFHPGGALGRRLLLTVADVMPRVDELPAVPGEVSLKEVVVAISRAPFGAICVVDAEQAIRGIITDGDIRRYLTRADDLSVSAESLMTRDPMTTRSDEQLGVCLAQMEQRKVYMLPVVDAAGRLAGMVRMHDIVG